MVAFCARVWCINHCCRHNQLGSKFYNRLLSVEMSLIWRQSMFSYYRPPPSHGPVLSQSLQSDLIPPTMAKLRFHYFCYRSSYLFSHPTFILPVSPSILQVYFVCFEKTTLIFLFEILL